MCRCPGIYRRRWPLVILVNLGENLVGSSCSTCSKVGVSPSCDLSFAILRSARHTRPLLLHALSTDHRLPHRDRFRRRPVCGHDYSPGPRASPMRTFPANLSPSPRFASQRPLLESNQNVETYGSVRDSIPDQGIDARMPVKVFRPYF